MRLRGEGEGEREGEGRRKNIKKKELEEIRNILRERWEDKEKERECDIEEKNRMAW